ncbi:MAG: two-component system sensor histidine kinase CreC [Alcanivorax sp.]|nr:two-component system sensor histidine kinase CreC [Alcanivorax sp.]
MTLNLRIMLVWLLLVGGGLILVMQSVIGQLPSTIRQASEEVLVDSANLLAELAALHWDQDFASDAPFVMAVERYGARRFDATIWSRHKTEPDFVLYVTDLTGQVMYHTDRTLIGADFSGWRDVQRTLLGGYGARTTRTDPGDENSSFMYVAAPVQRNGELLGVLSVGQPTASFEPFLALAREQLWQRGSLILLASLLLGAVLSLWLTRSIRRLVEYVEKLRRGERAAPPALRERELNRLAQATDAMRAEIDGKQYVEDYVHTLTHEMKSPLSAIRAATELLQEADVPEADQRRFLTNVDMESARLQRLIDRLLSLATVEKKQHLSGVENIDLGQLVKMEIMAKQTRAQPRNVMLQMVCERNLQVTGERFLLEQAVSNLLDNAIEFSPDNSAVKIKLDGDAERVWLMISNAGPPIPDYALARIFERFYSLPRPGSQRKSTGLGLSFVSEVAQLHQGEVRLRNLPERGVQAILWLPART